MAAIRYYWPKGLPFHEVSGGAWVLFLNGSPIPAAVRRVLYTRENIALLVTFAGKFSVDLRTGRLPHVPNARLRIDRTPWLPHV